MARRLVDIPTYRGDGVSVVNSGVDLGKGSPIVRASAVGAATLEVLSACSTPTPGPTAETTQKPVVVRTPTSEAVVVTVTPVPPTPEVVTSDQVVDVSLIGGQQEVIEYGSYGGNTYNYDFQNKTVVAPSGIEMAESTRVSFNQTAETLISVLGQPADAVDVKTSGQLGDKSRNVALAFDVEGNSESLYWPTAFGENSSSPDWSFSTPNVTAKDVIYNKIPLPPGVKHNQITVRFILGGPVENKIVEATATDGTVWVLDTKQGEFITMIDKPQGEMAAPYIDNYGKQFSKVYPDKQGDYTTEAINERLRGAEPEMYTAADGSPFKVLADPLTGQHLFLRTVNPQTHEWGEWKELTSRGVLELGVKPDDVFKLFGAKYSDCFAEIPTTKLDPEIANEFNFGYLTDTMHHQTEKQEGHLTLQNAIDAANSAKENGITTIGGPLVYGKSDFDYTSIGDKVNPTRDELITTMKNHIKAQMEGSGENIDIFIVTNETSPASELDMTWENPEKQSYDPYSRYIGEDYIDIAFQYARDIDTANGTRPPSTILIYNGTANHLPRGDYYWEGNNTQRELEFVNRLKSKGLIDGMGIQLHINAAQPPNIDAMIRTFQSYGLPVYVTEFDIDISGLQGTDAQKEQIRADLYRKILEGILRSNVTVGVNHWWAEQGSRGQLLDSNAQPTVNLFTEREVLFEHFFNN